eukprot:sb/3464674/
MFVLATLLVIGLASLLDTSTLSSSIGLQPTTTPPVYSTGTQPYTGSLPTPDPDECELVEVGGYLHEQCFLSNITPSKYYKCPLSNSLYRKLKSWGSNCYVISFSNTCPYDPGFYQVCGHGGCIGYKELGGTPLLCGTYICSNIYRGYHLAGHHSEGRNYRCRDGRCTNTNLNMVGCGSVLNITCDGKCDADFGCFDESICNGVHYGFWCHKIHQDTYFPPKDFCDGIPWCNGEDEIGCNNWTVADHTTCQHKVTGKTILIQDNMRCFDPEYSACKNRQDQTNCSDSERVAMQCLSQGFSTTISIWGYCQGYKLCDDDYNNVCVDPAEPGCSNLHKGQLCDGHPDCNNGGDETCKDLTKATRCIRRFHSPNGKKNVSLPIPLEWVMDGEVDCLDGIKDEDETSWVKCGKDYYTRYQEIGPSRISTSSSIVFQPELQTWKGNWEIVTQ